MNDTDRNETGTGSRRHFDPTDKRHTVELSVKSERAIPAVAEELGITSWILRGWPAGPAP